MFVTVQFTIRQGSQTGFPLDNSTLCWASLVDRTYFEYLQLRTPTAGMLSSVSVTLGQVCGSVLRDQAGQGQESAS